MSKTPKGFRWNPLTAFPRNAQCYCGSDLKAKKCCLPKVQNLCRVQDYAVMKATVKAATHGIPYPALRVTQSAIPVHAAAAGDDLPVAYKVQNSFALFIERFTIWIKGVSNWVSK